MEILSTVPLTGNWTGAKQVIDSNFQKVFLSMIRTEGVTEEIKAAAALLSQNAEVIKQALEEIKGSGDIPASTIAKVAENTAAINQLSIGMIKVTTTTNLIDIL